MAIVVRCAIGFAVGCAKFLAKADDVGVEWSTNSGMRRLVSPTSTAPVQYARRFVMGRGLESTKMMIPRRTGLIVVKSASTANEPHMTGMLPRMLFAVCTFWCKIWELLKPIWPLESTGLR